MHRRRFLQAATALGAAAPLLRGWAAAPELPRFLLVFLRGGYDSASLLLPLAGADVYAATPVAQRADRAIAEVRRLRDEIFNRCKLPRTLQETGKVTRDQLAQIADLTLDDGAIIINPKEADREQILAILEKAWG